MNLNNNFTGFLKLPVVTLKRAVNNIEIFIYIKDGTLILAGFLYFVILWK
jgi:hypothetical protein